MTVYGRRQGVPALAAHVGEAEHQAERPGGGVDVMATV
jgi:hypothetical protein